MGRVRAHRGGRCAAAGLARGEIEVNEPILVFAHKLGLNAVQPDGKQCTTLFQRRSYNGITSVVHCAS